MGATALGVISLVVGVAGGVMSYTAQSAAADTQSQFGLLNAQAQAQSARLQARQQQLSANIQAASSRAQAASAENNAQAILEQTETESRIAQENIRRDREEFRRSIGAMRAGASDSGVLETTGSPLDFLVAATEDEQAYESEARWQDEVNRRKGGRLAAVERAGGAAAGLNATLQTLEGASAMAAGRVGAAQAKLGGYAARATAAGMRASAAAGLVGDIGSSGVSAIQLYQNRTPRTAKPKATT